MQVTLFLRPAVKGKYSIEKVFQSLIPKISEQQTIGLISPPFATPLAFSFFYNLFLAYRRKGKINHITGDIHYVALVLPAKNTILTIHDLEFLNRSKGIKHLILKWIWLVLPARKVAIITVISEETRAQLVSYLPEVAKKTVVISNPLRFHIKGLNNKRINKKLPVILQLGTKKNKNLIRLFKALSAIPSHLIIVGSLSSEVCSSLKKLSISYTLLQNCSDAEIEALYRSSDLLTMVSLSEGFGLPVIEAQAHGLPVVTSNISSLPEVAGKGACFVNPYSPADIRRGILKVVHHDCYRRQLIENGIENCKRFDPSKIALSYQKIYARIAPL